MAGMGDLKLAESKATRGASQFDKKAFAKYLVDNKSAKEFGEGACAKHVRLALFAAGRKLNNWPVQAKDWGPSLLALGFVPVATAGYVAETGDIAVIQPPSSGVQAGHMQGYDGTNWVSDFVQDAFWPGPAYRKDKPAYVIYRY